MVVSCWGNWIKSESNFKGWLTAGGRERVSEFNVLSWTIRQRWNLCARIGNSLSRFSIDFATQHYMTLYRWRTNEAPDSDYISIWIRACVKGKGRKGWTWRSCCPCFVKLHQRGFSFLQYREKHRTIAWTFSSLFAFSADRSVFSENIDFCFPSTSTPLLATFAFFCHRGEHDIKRTRRWIWYGDAESNFQLKFIVLCGTLTISFQSFREIETLCSFNECLYIVERRN